MKARFQKIITCIFGLICFSTLSAFSQTIFNSNSNDSIKIKVSQAEHMGMLLEFIDLKLNTSDTVVHIHEIVGPEKIRDIQFDSEACGFVLETKSYFQYMLLVRSASGWKIKGQELFLVKNELRKVGFGGFKLLDIYTIRYKDNHYKDGKHRSEYRIHIFDPEGNKRILNQVNFIESKY